MSKKQKYNVFYNESMNSILSIPSNLKEHASSFYEYVGTFTKKQITRIESILKHRSLILPEIQYMIEFDSKFRYKVISTSLYSYEKVNGNRIYSTFVLPIYHEDSVEEQQYRHNSKLLESDSVYLRLGAVINIEGPWVIKDDCIQACNRINKDSSIYDKLSITDKMELALEIIPIKRAIELKDINGYVHIEGAGSIHIACWNDRERNS